MPSPRTHCTACLPCLHTQSMCQLTHALAYTHTRKVQHASGPNPTLHPLPTLCHAGKLSLLYLLCCGCCLLRGCIMRARARFGSRARAIDLTSIGEPLGSGCPSVCCQRAHTFSRRTRSTTSAAWRGRSKAQALSPLGRRPRHNRVIPVLLSAFFSSLAENKFYLIVKESYWHSYWHPVYSVFASSEQYSVQYSACVKTTVTKSKVASVK